jgi:DNA-binding beta-propeller fold protein YncE
MVRYLPACMSLFAIACASGASIAQDVILIPDSNADSVWVFSAVDGALIDNAFITDPGTDNGVDVFDRPMEVLVSLDGSLLVTDQFANVVSQFNANGTFVGILSLGGTEDTNIMNNIRGGHVLTQGDGAGDVLVTNSGAFNDLVVSQKNVKRLDPNDGSEKVDFAFNRYGGIRGPFDVIEYNGEVLVADEGQDKIVRYTLDGKFNERFTSSFVVPQLDFPQQMAITSNGNLLVCSFSNGVILEFDPDANLVGQYDPGTLDLYRGIAELDNGNLLVSTTTGVFEVTRTGIVVEIEAVGTGFRYLTKYTAPAGLLERNAGSDRAKPAIEMPKADPRDRQQVLDDERGLNHGAEVSQ